MLAVVITTYYGFYGGSLLGFLVRQSFELLKVTQGYVYLGWILAIALVLDLLIGVVQFLVAARLAARPAAAEHEPA